MSTGIAFQAELQGLRMSACITFQADLPGQAFWAELQGVRIGAAIEA